MTPQTEELHAEIALRTDSLVDKLHGLEVQLGGAVDRVRDRISLRRQHEERPWRSVGVAFALGFVLGMR